MDFTANKGAGGIFTLDKTEDVLPASELERLRAAGFAVVPLEPSDEQLKVGQSLLFQPPADTRDLSAHRAAMNTALAKARVMHCGMIRVGGL